MVESGAVERFDRAVMTLPYSLRERARELRREDRAEAEEFRLRLGRAPAVVLPRGEVSLGGDPVTARELEGVLEAATGASMHSVRDKLREGFITVKGGFRIGICGSVALQEGRVVGFTAVSSVAVRISRELIGVSDAVMPRLLRGGEMCSALIVSPPGGGKTTLLRDIVRAVSDGENGLRVGLCDERGEIAAFCGGEAQMDVGRRTDTVDGCPKALAVTMLLRAMNPQLIALDEITGEEDAASVIRAAHCGVKLLATAHASGLAELGERPVYRELMAAGIFEKLVVISRAGGRRRYSVESLR